ncbi:MAG: UvrD-helicase domain-containing protein [Deltaproteobacteria bacterium]|nr:UvrD-helicase domain-containing protein [Deltaproteobacteria bacterium]
MDYLQKLNGPQRAAVEWGAGPILILAGAGSGKTRVLTSRIAHLIQTRQADPTQIFAVTFTNKAAAEMRHRVHTLLNEEMGIHLEERDLWVSTFHSACVRILRSHGHFLGFPNHFTIYDDSDQLSLVKACMRELNVSETTFSPKSIQGRINKIKNEGYDASNYKSTYGGPFEDAFLRVFSRYTEALKQSAAMDFGDLILQTVKLFTEHPNVLKAFQDRLGHVLVDEYQDTNRCQYLLVKKLVSSAGNICVVGDEDQSIYRWRGADISNILNFEKDYPAAKIFKLEENYRSTRNIIEAASRVIANNTERRDKTLFTNNTEGDKILLSEAYDEHDEAFKVISDILNGVTAGESLNQIAVFYRTNAQSRVIEDVLRTKGIQYQIYGGLKFYDRLEVKDSLAYLKLIANPSDDVSFRRIVNVPPRGIGNVTLERLMDQARVYGVSLFSLLEKSLGPEPTITVDLGRSRKSLLEFYNLMAGLRAAKPSLLPSDLLNMVLEETNYRSSLQKEDSVEAQSRLENLAELRQGIVEYELRSGGDDPNKKITLETYLEEIALVSDLDRYDPTAPALKLMTIHMAKGLEFDRVHIVGLEEELFPNIRSWDAAEPSDIEEERRLLYVGMTRARKRLFLYFAKNRTVFGTSHFRVESRFLEEIPKEYLETKKADYFTRRRHYLDRPGLPPRSAHGEEYSQVGDFDPGFEQGPSDDEDLRAGSKVEHPIFGLGIVRQVLGDDKIVVEFRGRGTKKISRKFTQLREV